MKLSQWAKEQGISYITAFRWFQQGKLPVKSYKTPSGSIFVTIDNPSTDKADKIYTYARVSAYQKKMILKDNLRGCWNFVLQMDGRWINL